MQQDPLTRFAARRKTPGASQKSPTSASKPEPEYAEQGSHLEPGKLDLKSSYEAWRTKPSSSGMAQLLRAAKPSIDKAMTLNTGAVNPALSGRAKLMAIQAIKSYDPKQGASLNGWLATHLQGLKRYSQAPVAVGVPFKVRVDANKIYAASEEHRNIYGTPPTDEELADATNISAKRIAYVRKMSRPVVATGSLLADDGDEVVDATPAVSTENYEKIWEDYVYNDLDPQTRKMYDMRVGRGAYESGAVPVKEIARQLGVSSSAVSQRLNAVARKLAEGFQFEERY